MWTLSSQLRVKAGWPLILDILFVFSDIDSSDSPDNKLINAWPAMQSNATAARNRYRAKGWGGTMTFFYLWFWWAKKRNTLRGHLLTSSHSSKNTKSECIKVYSDGSPHKYNWHLNIWKRERDMVRELEGRWRKRILFLYTGGFTHWQSNNTTNECIIILLDIHWWSKRDGKVWQFSDFCLFFSRKSFICFYSFF